MNLTNLVRFPGLGLEFNVSRVAFSIGGFQFYWYGLLIAGGLLLAALFALSRAKDFGLDDDRMVDVILIGTVASVICARAYYVAFAPFQYESFWDMINIRDGGVAIYGAVIGAFVFGGLACKWRKIPVLAMFDVTAMGFLIGQTIGRWGNFVNQEAFGTNTTLPWGMISENTTAYLASVQASLAAQGITADPFMPVHPTFLYESIWCLIGFLGLLLYYKRRKFDGEILLLYVAWYGAGRAWIEGLRTDSLYIGTFRMSQLLAIASSAAAIILLLLLYKKYKRTPAVRAVDKMRAEQAARQADEAAETGEVQQANEVQQAAEAPKADDGQPNEADEKEQADGQKTDE